MMPLIFATNNRHKVAEIQSAVGSACSIITLADAGISIEIPEPYDTLEQNASEKSKTIYRLTGQPSFGEDTGLEVKALNGAPGVQSARYAGEERDDHKNITKLLAALQTATDRTARFRTVISLIIDNQEYFFEGICEGVIEMLPRGSQGFGYDPLFRPHGSEQTFAEMTMQEKGMYSHRKKAIDKLVLFLQTAGKAGNLMASKTNL